MNRGALMLLASLPSRAASTGRSRHGQFRLGAAHDSQEAEADNAAEKLMQPDSEAIRIGRRSAHSGHEPEVPDSVARELERGGAALDGDVRRDMERRFNHDFSQVRIHTGASAASSARDIGARAYTAGEHIVFGARGFAPRTQRGRHLLGHELAHVVQQSPGSSLVQRDLEDWRRTQDRLENFRQVAEMRYIANRPRHLYPYEAEAAKLVFGNALDTSGVIISEGGAMTIGGYARTLPNRIYFPEGSFDKTNFLAYLIHELTHVWHYQRGAAIPGMIWEAIVANYDYGGAAGLEKAWAQGKAFDEFTTEQQGDILSDYYDRLTADADVSAYQPFVDDVRNGREKVHRYQSVRPLEVGTLDIARLNAEYRDKLEAEIIRELKAPMAPNDARAVARADRIVKRFGSLTYWSIHYRERFEARRSADELVNLILNRLSESTVQRIFATLGLRPQQGHGS